MTQNIVQYTETMSRERFYQEAALIAFREIIQREADLAEVTEARAIAIGRQAFELADGIDHTHGPLAIPQPGRPR